MPALLPEWAYGHWKSRDVYEHQRDVLDDFEGYRAQRPPARRDRDRLALGDAVQHLALQPAPVPRRRAGMIERMRADGRPHRRLGDAVGQPRLGRRPAPAGPRVRAPAPAPGLQLRRGAVGRPLRPRRATASRYVGRWWMGIGSPVDFTSPAARRWWQEQARPVLELGVEGIKADDGEGYYIPPDVALRRRPHAAPRRPGPTASLYRRTMQEVLDEVHPGTGVLFGRCGWSGQQAIGMTWGGDQASDFWSLRTLVAATLTAAASGFSNWSHDVGGYLGKRLVERCPRELLAALGAVRLLHAADAGARPLRAGGLALRRPHARRLPRATCSCTSGSSPTSAPPRRPRRAAGCRSSGRWR